MADIFLSYSREDRTAIEPLAEQIVAAGYSVWWDRDLSGGTRYLDETESQLNTAKVVLVVWSKTSITSHWVADEAGAGRDTGRLLPISIDGSIPPLGFRQFQVIDFANWARDGSAIKSLLAAVAKFATRSDAATTAPGSAVRSSGVAGIIRRRVVFGGIALAGVALIAVVVSNTALKSDVKIQNQRAAFFGFTASDDNPVANQVAIAATDETYTTLTALAVETAARGETQGVELHRQMATALALGARYVLAGTVRTQGDSVTVSIRLDDTKSRATVWQATLIGDKSQIKSLPVRAAARSTNLLHCITKLGADLEPADSRKLGIAARACDSGTNFDRDTALRWRELVNLAPKSAHAQIGLARALYLLSASVPQAERPEVLVELSDAVSKALTLDPQNAQVRVHLAVRKIAEGRPLSEVVKDLDDASALAVKTVDRRGASVATSMKMLLLMSVGRGGDALAESRSVNQGDPLYPSTPIAYAQALAAAGRIDEALKILEEANARLQDGLVWQTLVPYAFMVDADRALRAIDERPPTSRDETAACWRQAAEYLKTGDPNLRRTIVANLPTCELLGMAWLTHLMLDDLDGAFADLRRRQDRTNPLEFIRSTQHIFLEPTRKLRADPRFLPFAKDGGIYQYWLDTGTHPTVCDTAEERDFPVCVELRKDQGK